MSVQAVIFDIGNVLIEWKPERYYDAVIGADRRRAMFAEVDLHGMNDVVDRGGDFTSTIYDWAEKYPAWRDEIRMWHDQWLKLATPAIPHSARLMRGLKARGVPILCWTVRSAKQEIKARHIADNITFEGYIPVKRHQSKDANA